jgi:RimJ/RimL family protein N-acetyltransferase
MPQAGTAEARHNLILGLASRLVTHPGLYEIFHLWLVADAGRTVGAGLMTPPHKLVIADGAPEAIEALARGIHESKVPTPGVVGNRPAVEHFISSWEGVSGDSARLSMDQGVFELTEVTDMGNARGRSRPATEADRDLLIAWMGQFRSEALVDTEEFADGADEDAKWVDSRLNDPEADVWLWEDGADPVSMSAYGGRTPNGTRIGPVYTPPEHRGHGYATSLVAEQSAWLLAGGYRFCFLYTDVANPTSNAIYRRIGYEQIAESAEYRFANPEVT